MHPFHCEPTRRQALLTGLGFALGAPAVWAQSAGAVSPAQMERQAAELPLTGANLKLPELGLFGGGQFRPAQAQGQITVVYWWASTCPFCAQQSPEIQKLWQTWNGKGMQMLALSVDRSPDEAIAYLAKKGYTFPSAWVSAEVHQRFPKPRGLPVTLVIGRDGKVLQAERGQMFAEDVAQIAQWIK